MSPCLLIRGLSRQQLHWGLFPQYLKEMSDCRILFEDLPGFGERRDILSPNTIEEISANLTESVIQQGSKVNLIGISLGGMVALELARKHPQKVNSLVLINSSFKPYAKFYQRLKPSAYSAVMQAWLNPRVKESEREILKLSTNTRESDSDLLDEWVNIRIQHPPSRRSTARQIMAARKYCFNGPKPIENILMLASKKDKIVNPICTINAAKAWGITPLTHDAAGHDIALDAPKWLAQEISEWYKNIGV